MLCPSCHAETDGSTRFCPSCGALLARDAAAADPLVGVMLGGKYRVTRKVGEGGMGAVYEGEQQLGTATRRVAIKTLHPHLVNDPTIGARFEREVGTIAQLEHPNTIQVYDFGSTPEGILYLVMEFLQGQSLADALSTQGPMPPERAQNIVLQTCGSLGEAHARGIVHRDLKPDNIVLIERAGLKDFVKVLDFGIAKRGAQHDRTEQKLTQQGMVLGTPPYMSPEQFTGRAIDARSDIYSLGVVTYELLTGNLPFKADTAWEWATQHMTRPPIPIESQPGGARLPPAMRAAIGRSLAKSPEERFQTIGEFGDALAGKGVTTGGVPTHRELAPFGPEASGMAGQVGFPTPGGIAQTDAPAPVGRSRSILLAAASLILVASVTAIVFAMRTGSGGSKDAPIDNGAAPPPPTSLAPANASVDMPNANANEAIPPLNNRANGVVARPHPAGHSGTGAASARPTDAAASASHPTKGSPRVAPSQLPKLPPKAEAADSEAPPAAKYDGPECETARTLTALGNAQGAEPWVAACIAKGGAM